MENTGVTDEEVIRQHSIGSSNTPALRPRSANLTVTSTGNAFLDLPLDDKRKHPCNFAEANFFGYREGFRMMGNSGVKDNSEACAPLNFAHLGVRADPA